jgi:hypothetical protein
MKGRPCRGALGSVESAEPVQISRTRAPDQDELDALLRAYGAALREGDHVTARDLEAVLLDVLAEARP